MFTPLWDAVINPLACELSPPSVLCTRPSSEVTPIAVDERD